MKKIEGTNFPDKAYLEKLIKQSRAKMESYQKDRPVDQLITISGAALNWVADYVSDENAIWTKEELKLDDLWLTGTNPSWNRIVIEQCERSPQKLRDYFKSVPDATKIFSDADFSDLPILVRSEEEKYKVLDGMHRVIAAIRDDKTTIQAYLVKIEGEPRPQCEPHVVYDLLRSYQRKINHDRAGLIAALRFLRTGYANVDELLKTRLGKEWISDKELRTIIDETLK